MALQIADNPVIAEEVTRQARVALARIAAKEKDILTWGACLFPKKFPLPFCDDLHKYLISIRHLPATNTEAPRYHAKTTNKCFLVPIFQALEEPETFDFYMNIQSTEKKALAINISIRTELEFNESLREIYGDQTDTKKWTDELFVTKKGIVFMAVSAGQSIRGVNYENRRPDYVIVDDLYNDEDIENLESTQKKREWLMGTAYLTMAIGKRTSFHLQGTAINGADALGFLKKDPDFQSRTFKAIVDEEKKIALWPEAKSFETLLKLRRSLGIIIFNREMMNERRNDAESIIKMAYLKDWEYDPLELRTELARGDSRILLQVIIGEDPSIGKDKEADEDGVALVLKTGWVDSTKGTEWWIEHTDGAHRSVMERIHNLEVLAERQQPPYKVTLVVIEAVAGFDDYASEVIRKTNLPVQRVVCPKDKITNLINRSKFFENGKVHLSKNIAPEDKDKLISQLTTNYPKHDDRRDGLLLTMDETDMPWNY